MASGEAGPEPPPGERSWLAIAMGATARRLRRQRAPAATTAGTSLPPDHCAADGLAVYNAMSGLGRIAFGAPPVHAIALTLSRPYCLKNLRIDV